MTGKQRREQLISIGRSAFAEQGFEWDHEILDGSNHGA
jgi:hypothetical protein